jgi:hypothetical protein
MRRSARRLEPDYDLEFVKLERDDTSEYPVQVTLRRTDEARAGQEVSVRARYVVGCDGARSRVRADIGQTLLGDTANHAWGVMDALAVTDFPDIRLKAAIQSAERQMAVELAEHGITANCVAPGPVDAPLTRNHHSPATREAYHRSVPVKRYGQPSEIASAVGFLCSEGASYVNGQIIAVDGGFLAAGLLEI